ncbi:MAG: Cu(I)/Ag(I) efflux system membrane fusion protein, partial [Parvicella sp.]
MKKYIIYIAVLVLGLALGWVIFGNNSNEKQSSDATLEEIWTCSMHPQIRQPEPGDCPLCGMDLIPLEANSNSNPLVFEMTEDAIKIANIQTTVIGSGSADTVGLKLSGKIKVDETNSASIVTHISGRIEKLYISFTGEKVVKGQKIASIYSPSLISAQKELLEAYKVKEVNPKLYEATVNKLKFWKITAEQIESIISSETILESFNIYAGFSGVVLSKKVSVGDYLKEGEVLFDIQNLNQLWAVFDVYETDLGKINT